MLPPRVALVALLLGAAGCVTPPLDAPAPAATTAPEPYAFAACSQFHMYFPSPASAFETFAPEGFALATEDDAGLVVNVRVEATSCEERAEVWVEVPVEPASYDGADVEAHTAPVVAYSTSDADVEQYAAWGMSRFVERASIEIVLDGPAPAIRIGTPNESYEFLPRLGPAEGEFAPFVIARWVPNEAGDASSHLWRDHAASQSVGLGGVTMTHMGSGGAPPFSTGVAHLVRDLSMVTTLEAAS